MKNSIIKTLLESFDQNYFDMAKKQFAEDVEKYVSVKDYKLAGVLLKMITREKHLAMMDKEEFNELLSSLFYNELEDKDILVDYVELLSDEIGGDGNDYRTEGRAKRYSDHLQKNFIEPVKAKVFVFEEKSDEEAREFLVDFINILLAIYKQHCLLENIKENISSIDFSVEHEYVKRLTEGLFDNKTLFEELGDVKGSNIFQKIFDNKDATVITSKRMFFYYLTWLIYIRICQDNGSECGGQQ